MIVFWFLFCFACESVYFKLQQSKPSETEKIASQIKDREIDGEKKLLIEFEAGGAISSRRGQNTAEQTKEDNRGGGNKHTHTHHHQITY